MIEPLHNISNELQHRNREKAKAKNPQRTSKNPELQKLYLEDENPYTPVSKMRNKLIQKSTTTKGKSEHEQALYSLKCGKKKEQPDFRRGHRGSQQSNYIDNDCTLLGSPKVPGQSKAPDYLTTKNDRLLQSTITTRRKSSNQVSIQDGELEVLTD